MGEGFLGLDIPYVPLALGIGSVYAGYFVASYVALSLLVANEGEQWALDVAYYTLFVTSGLHFALSATGFLFVDEYEPYPVGPTWAFLYADHTQAAALGAAATAYALAPSEQTPIMVATLITIYAQLLCFYKTAALVTGVWEGRRNRYTGKRL